MDLRIQKTYEALFAPEDIREVFRESLPTGPDADGETTIRRIGEALKQTLVDIESGTGQPEIRTIGASLPIRDREEAYGLSWEKVWYLTDAFDEIAEKYQLEVVT